LGRYPFCPLLRLISLLMVDWCTPIICAISVCKWPIFNNVYIWYRCIWVSYVYVCMSAPLICGRRGTYLTAAYLSFPFKVALAS
jgi:hypothetical protein